jgi:hypothetical protein
MSQYKPNAQIYDSQFVIRDSTTVTSSSSGGLIVEGGVSSKAFSSYNVITQRYLIHLIKIEI